MDSTEETKKCDTCGGDLADNACANCTVSDEATTEEAASEESTEESA